jgi:hypothetical protein
MENHSGARGAPTASLLSQMDSAASSAAQLISAFSPWRRIRAQGRLTAGT